MKTVEIKLYQFNELSEEAKQNALNELQDLNVDHEWWDVIYEDAEQIGIKLTSFNLNRGGNCEGEFIASAEECAYTIQKEHGETCDTHQTATEYLKDRDSLVEGYSDGVNKMVVAENNEYDFDQDCDSLDYEFRLSLLGDYLKMLNNEYEYQTSEESVIETIQANEYDFTEEGELY